MHLPFSPLLWLCSLQLSQICHPGHLHGSRYSEQASFGLHILVICSQINTGKICCNVSLVVFLQISPPRRGGCIYKGIYTIYYYIFQPTAWKFSLSVLSLPSTFLASWGSRMWSPHLKPQPQDQAASQSLQQAADASENYHLVFFSSPAHLWLSSVLILQQNPVVPFLHRKNCCWKFPARVPFCCILTLFSLNAFGLTQKYWERKVMVNQV